MNTTQALRQALQELEYINLEMHEQATRPMHTPSALSVFKWSERLREARAALAAVEQAQGDDELKAWREMFAAFAASSLPDGWPNLNPKLWPNNWPQDVAMVAFVLHQKAQPAPQEQDVCTWTPDSDPDFSIWETTCGNAWSFETEGPKENGVKFCPYCGKPLVIAETGEQS